MDISFERFGSLLDIDKLIQKHGWWNDGRSFSSLLDIDKLIPFLNRKALTGVLVLCWILSNFSCLLSSSS